MQRAGRVSAVVAQDVKAGGRRRRSGQWQRRERGMNIVHQKAISPSLSPAVQALSEESPTETLDACEKREAPLASTRSAAAAGRNPPPLPAPEPRRHRCQIIDQQMLEMRTPEIHS